LHDVRLVAVEAGGHGGEFFAMLVGVDEGVDVDGDTIKEVGHVRRLLSRCATADA
jgi:hypothetical protein